MFKSGFISIVGRPNVGKSTLLNAILLEKISITSHKPQTTRNKINGIKQLKHAQLIFVDTPGIHQSNSKLNQYMIDTSMSTLEDVDIILFMTDVIEKSREKDDFILSKFKKGKKPVFLLINKIDVLKSKDMLLPIIEFYSNRFSFSEIFPLSVREKSNIDLLEKKITAYLPEGPRFFPEDMITEHSERFLVGEMIREKITVLTRNELPYSVAVIVRKMTEKDTITVIDADIFVEKESQKKIVIGKGGKMLKEIGKNARTDIERLLRKSVYLNLWIKVREKWTTDDKSLKEFGYGL